MTLSTGKRFLPYTFERALKTFIQTVLAVLIAAYVFYHLFVWQQALIVGGVAAVLSIITSIIVYNTASTSKEFELTWPLDDGEH